MHFFGEPGVERELLLSAGLLRELEGAGEEIYSLFTAPYSLLPDN
jgi:hypothetical protein